VGGGFAESGEMLVGPPPVPVMPEPLPPPAPDDAVSSAPVAPGGVLGPDVILPEGEDPFAPDDGVPFWLWSAGVLATVAAAAFLLAARRLRTPSTRSA
jgi:hypothetical protein